MTPWDAYDAYLFDIDGTLLNATDAVHYFAFCEALTLLAGRPINLDGVNAHGNVDNGNCETPWCLAASRRRSGGLDCLRSGRACAPLLRAIKRTFA